MFLPYIRRKLSLFTSLVLRLILRLKSQNRPCDYIDRNNSNNV